MIDRRGLLLGLTGALALPGLSGCAQVRRFFQPEVSRTAIDIHTHFFNGRDVPVVGFLKQTIIRDPHAPVDPDMTTDAFLKLLTSILLVNTPTAQAELEDLFVAPEVWRMGVGRKLLAEAEYRAAMLGARTLHVVAGERARPFYEAAGYRFAETIATDFAPAVELHKDLP